MHYHTIIIGAGPAGLFAAQAIAEHQKKVLIIERNHTAGKKLLISGAGQCNFTHAGQMEDFFACYGEQAKFLKKAFVCLDNKKTMRFFKESGVPYEIEANGKVFPKSRESQSILEALLVRCQKAGVQFQYGELVNEIALYDGAFTVETEKGKRYFADHVVLATGGMSYPQMGSDGKGYELAQKLGHQIINPRPALTDVRLANWSFKKLSGVSVKEVEITIWHEGKKKKTYCGDLLFTHKGLSGPVIINSSRWMTKGDSLTVNFIYPKSYEEIRTQMKEMLPRFGKGEVGTFLKPYRLPKALLECLFDTLDLDMHKSCAEVSKKEREALVKGFTGFRFEIESLGDFQIAMVTAGGIKLKEINPTTMESRKQKNLYCIGEVLDIDGDTGGYNIQAAFSTAALCAKSILNEAFV